MAMNNTVTRIESEYDSCGHVTGAHEVPARAIPKVTEAEAGCWLDGANWGWTGPARVVELAQFYGMPDETGDDNAILAAFKESADRVTMANGDVLEDPAGLVCDQGELGDQAEEWLNENVAPEGYSFGWHNGDFFLMCSEWWAIEAI
jgi:hypothetical protein